MDNSRSWLNRQQRKQRPRTILYATLAGGLIGVFMENILLLMATGMAVGVLLATIEAD